ncbi:MAG: hypothetical protein ACYC5M_17015 [Anaerolineae bacterium]
MRCVMVEQRSTKPVSTAQIIGILASTLALFFLVAFATKAFDAYRLRNWRDRLKVEIVAMERQRLELEAEKKRRQPDEYAEQVLRDAGRVPEGGVLVMVAQRPAAAVGEVGASATEAKPVEASPSQSDEGALFRNAHWNAWKQLIWGFD